MKDLWLYPFIKKLQSSTDRAKTRHVPTGELLTVCEGRREQTDALLYRPAGKTGPLPVLFTLHGGSWIFGSAAGCDCQSRYLAELFGAAVVSIDYTLLLSAPFPLQQKQAAAVIRHVLDHADDYGVLPTDASLMGFSAGAHIAAGTDILLRGQGVTLKKVFLCYPFLNFVGFSHSAYARASGFKKLLVDRGSDYLFFQEMPKESLLLSPGAADPALLKNLSPTVLLACGDGDDLKPQAESYYNKLRAAGVPAVYREFPAARHGFLEVNFPDHKPSFAKSDEQEALMREAYAWLKDVFYE